MKNKITILLLFIATSVSAQLEKFEGFWMSKDTSFNTLITHNSSNNFLTLNSFSFTDNTLFRESIQSVSDNEINTISISENNWNLLVKYTMVNDTIMKASLTGSTTITLIYEKITD
tara:strand:+ start:758 stop:1105 length:348 start_codon:yes stop_codon:yes gene_type:complete